MLLPLLTRRRSLGSGEAREEGYGQARRQTRGQGMPPLSLIYSTSRV